MSELLLYKASFDIEDDPAYFSGSILLVAATEKEAKKVAKQAAKDAYYRQAGGWASDSTKVTRLDISPFTIPTKAGVVMTSATYER